MDQFKRCYSNEDTITKAIPFFWENFDPEGWSIWKCDYKYNDELKMIFMSSNLVSGMFQRLDKLRKTAFASVLIIGEDNNNEISGVWVMRGQELAFDVSIWAFIRISYVIGSKNLGCVFHGLNTLTLALYLHLLICCIMWCGP